MTSLGDSPSRDAQDSAHTFLPLLGNMTSVPPPEGMSAYHQMVIERLRYSTLILYLITFVFGLTGNSLTIVVILRNQRMKTVATCFILNLAVADNLFMFSLPFKAHNTFTSNWLFGRHLCKLMSAFYSINLFASIFTMVLMSMDRYLAIVHPLKSLRYRTKRNAVIICVMLWAICCVVMTPIWMYADVTNGSHSNVSICRVNWPARDYQSYVWFWTIFQLMLGFIIPICVMMVCYLCLLRHLVTHRSTVQRHLVTTRSTLCAEQARQPLKKVTVMVFIVTVVFVVCWTPYHILAYDNACTMRTYMTSGIPPSHSQHVTSSIMLAIAQALVFLSSCCNPFIYAISSDNFRKY